VPSCVSRPSRAFRFYSFLLDAAAAAPSSLAHPLSAQHSRLVVRLLSLSLYPLPSNSTHTRPFVLTPVRGYEHFNDANCAALSRL